MLGVHYHGFRTRCIRRNQITGNKRNDEELQALSASDPWYILESSLFGRSTSKVSSSALSSIRCASSLENYDLDC